MNNYPVPWTDSEGRFLIFYSKRASIEFGIYPSFEYFLTKYAMYLYL